MVQDSGIVDKKAKVKKEDEKANGKANGEAAAEETANSKSRVLVGVMRVGLLAKQLLLKYVKSYICIKVFLHNMYCI